jgi:hypothetical protein
MPFQQTFTYAYQVTFGTNGAITLNPSNPRGPVTVSDSADAGTADNTSRLGDINNELVNVDGLNNRISNYYGTGVVGGTPGLLLSDQNGRWVFLTNTQYTVTTNGTSNQNGSWPPPPTGVALATDTGVSAADGTTSAAAIKGTTLAGSSVTLTSSGGTVIGTGTADASGNFSISPTSGLVQGSNTISVTATLNGGTSTASTITFNYDTVAPTAATITGVSDNAGAVQGQVANGTATDDTTLTLTGTAEAGATVNVLNGTTIVGTATAAADGTWTATTSALSGTVSLTARATDTAGNQGAASGARTATIDTVAPTAPASVALANDTGASGTDRVTTDSTIRGTAEAGSTVRLTIGTTVVGTGTADASGNFSIAPTSGLVQGSNTVSVTATDAAGNTGAASSITFTLDNAAPAVTSIAASGAEITNGTGALNAGDVVTFTVNATDALAVAGTPTLSLNNGGTATYTGGGGTNALTFSYAVAQGQDTADLAVTALNGTVTDAAGNAVLFNSAAAGNPAGTLAVDTAAPTATTTIGLAQDSGAQGDGVSANPALAGTVSTGEAGLTVTIRDGGAVIGTATTVAGGGWTFANASATDGAHSYSAAVTDAAGNSGASTATSPASTTVDRQADADVAVDLRDATAAANTASVSFDLAGLDAGSTATVTFTGSDGGSVVRSFTANGAQTADVTGLRGDLSATVQVADGAGNTAAGQGDTLAADPVCFMPGTLVATPSGERAVETLRAGELVLTADGRAAPVRWLGRQTVSTRFADPLRVLPVRVVAGALGENLPARDLLVSADHALLVDGVLVQAGALVNGSTIRREAGVPEVFTYWHVELADHALVLAEGVPAETFIDNVARLAFDNWDEHEAAGSEAPIAEMELPRAKSARQVPAATRRRLADRAALLLGGQTTAAA